MEKKQSMVNIYDSANQLASDLQKIDEFKNLDKAIKAVKANKESLALFKKMDSIQAQIIKAQQTGQKLPADSEKEYKELNAKIKEDSVIMQLFQAEQSLYGILDDVQKTFTKPMNDLYDDLRNS